MFAVAVEGAHITLAAEKPGGRERKRLHTRTRGSAVRIWDLVIIRACRSIRWVRTAMRLIGRLRWAVRMSRLDRKEVSRWRPDCWAEGVSTGLAVGELGRDERRPAASKLGMLVFAGVIAGTPSS